MRPLLLLALALPFVLGGCASGPEPGENAAPAPSANAVAPPVVPNGVSGGPGDLKPGTGAPAPR